jgi:U2-associated protein SR140
LKFEFTTDFESFVSDPDYDSSEEEDSGDEEARPAANEGEEGDVAEYLNPLQKAKLTHLLSRLPTSTARLRKGDVARITAFAISHAGRGSEEVVRMLIDNVERPFAFSGANPERRSGHDDAASDGGELSGGEGKEKEKEDPSSAKLIGLFLISDLLSSSSTSGVRHAWRYRQIFESALRARRLFNRLGQLERDLDWGKMRAEKWRRAVTQLLTLWEGWCVFSSTAQEELLRDFVNSADEKANKPQADVAERRALQESKRSAWKAVAESDEAGLGTRDAETAGAASDEDVDGVPMEEDEGEEDLDGQPMDEDDDMDGEPMEDGSGDGEPMDEDGNDGDEQMKEPDGQARQHQYHQYQAGEESTGSRAAEARRRRPRAVDMFADSDGE